MVSVDYPVDNFPVAAVDYNAGTNPVYEENPIEP